MLEEIRTLLSEREPLYAGAADIEIDTEDKTPVDIAREIFGAQP